MKEKEYLQEMGNRTYPTLDKGLDMAVTLTGNCRMNIDIQDYVWELKGWRSYHGKDISKCDGADRRNPFATGESFREGNAS